MISAKGTTYVYDGLGQLRAEEESTGLRIAYEYDRFGNRARMLVTGDGDYAVTYEYDKNNRLLRDVKAVGDVVEKTSYQYDPNGNQLVKEKETISPAGTAGESLMGFDVGGSCIELRKYNGFGQLESVYIDGTVASYQYKPDGMRYQKTVDGVAETHIWNGTNVVAEVNAESGVKSKYLRGANLIAREDACQAKSYYLFNAHGDIVQKRDVSNGDLWYYVYDAFGVERDVDGQDKDQDTNPFRYCGEFFDKETDAIYLRARYYLPGIGCFTTADPEKNGLNWYAYCMNNPVKYADPSGKTPRMSLEDYLKSKEQQNFAESVNYDPFDQRAEMGRRAAVYPVKSNTKGTTYKNHGNSLDFSASQGTQVYAATGGIVEQVDWGYSDDYAVRPFQVKGKDGKEYTVYYEVDNRGNVKRDRSGKAIEGNPYGNSIRIRVDEGDSNPNNDPVAIYAHMAYSESAPVQVGDYVPIDVPIGNVGNTGNSYGAHLHYEIRNTTNPVSYYLPKV